MTKQIFALFFRFIRELDLYSPLTFSLILRANSNPILPPYCYLLPPPTYPPIPSPSTHGVKI